MASAKHSRAGHEATPDVNKRNPTNFFTQLVNHGAGVVMAGGIQYAGLEGHLEASLPESLRDPQVAQLAIVAAAGLAVGACWYTKHTHSATEHAMTCLDLNAVRKYTTA